MNDELVIFIGDDTGGTFGRKLEFTISVEEGTSLDGCSAEFVFDGITRTFVGPLVDGETREIVYSAEETAAMQKGVRYAAFRVIDANGKVRTFTNTIRVRCTDIVAEVYPGTSGISITIGGGSVAWNDITGKPNFAPVATSGSYNDLSDKPTIPAAVTVDSALSELSENPVQNKVVTAALNGKATVAQGAKADAALSRAEAVAGFTEWAYSGLPTGAVVPEEGKPSYEDGHWGFYFNYNGTSFFDAGESGSEDATSITFLCTDIDNVQDPITVTATRTRLPTMADIPTDNAQLANGAGYATTAEMNTALPYALVTPTTRNEANLLDSIFPFSCTAQGMSVSKSLSEKSDLHYSSGVVSTDLGEPFGEVQLFTVGSDGTFLEEVFASNITFNGVTPTANVTPVLGFTEVVTLTDRAINVVSLSSTATGIRLVFPAAQTGKVRDFLVRLTLTETNDVVPSVTFPADVAYETEGGEWPDLTEAGTYIVRLTEVPKASESETARFFLQCSSSVADATPPSAGGAA